MKKVHKSACFFTMAEQKPPRPAGWGQYIKGPMSAERILVVDDDAELRTLLADYLRKHGFEPEVAKDGAELTEALKRRPVDLIVLDVMMPGEDGFTLCRNLRARSAIPIVMLTARAEDTDRIVGLELGADDYLAKPFNPRELVARIKNVLRRTHEARQLSQAGAEPAPAVRRYRFRGHELDLLTRTLVTAEGARVTLTGAEFKLLRAFVDRPQRVLSRDQLMELCAGREIDPFDRSIDVLVSRLRQRLGDDARSSAIIKTVRSEGYVLVADVERE